MVMNTSAYVFTDPKFFKPMEEPKQNKEMANMSEEDFIEYLLSSELFSKIRINDIAVFSGLNKINIDCFCKNSMMLSLHITRLNKVNANKIIAINTLIQDLLLH